MNNEIVVLIGFSGSGKDSVASAINEKYGHNFVISATTRPVRPGESEGKPYRFISKAEFENTDFIETRIYNTLVKGKKETWYYGVPTAAIENDEKYVVVLDWKGYLDFKRIFPSRVRPVFLVASEELRRERSINRGGFDITEWNRRYEDDKEIFLKNMPAIYEDCQMVESLNIDTTVAEIMK